MPSFAYGAPEQLAPHLPAGSTQLWDDVPELHVWGEAQDFTLRTAEHPLGRVATIGACFTDEKTYAKNVANALEHDTPESLTTFPGNYTTILMTPNGTRILQGVAGVTPVYYGSSEPHPVISSRPSIAAKGAIKLLPEHIAAHLTLTSWDGGIDANKTCFDGVSRLGGGQALEITGEGTTLSTYEPLNPDPSLTLKQGAVQLREALRDSVNARIQSGVKIRSNLSGGKDSSAIVALALEHLGPNDTLPVYFMDDPDLASGDRDYVTAFTDVEPRLKLTRINAQETAITDDPETIEQPEDLALAVSPHRFQVISDIYASSRKAGAALHLSGNGGDEVVAVGSSHLPDLLTSGRLVRLAKEGIARAKIRNTSPLELWYDVAALVLQSGYRMGHKSAKALAGTVNFEPFNAPPTSLDPTGVNLVAAGLLTPRARQSTAQLLLAHARQLETKAPTLGHFLAKDQIYASGIAQAIEAYCAEQDSGISVEAPFLDNEVVRTALAVDVLHKGDPYNFKLILQEALHDILPEPILNRKTKGVYDPHNARLHIETLGLLSGLMKDSRLAKLDIIDPEVVCSILPSLGSLPPATLWALDRVMTTELWLRSLERSGLTTINRISAEQKNKPEQIDAVSNQEVKGIFAVPETIHAVASEKGTLTLYSRKTNAYYPLDTVQSHILRAFAIEGSVAATVDALANRYKNVDRRQLDADTRRTLRTFADKGIIAQSEVFAARQLPQTAQQVKFTSGESKMAQSSRAERPLFRKRILASTALIGAVALSKIAPGKRLAILNGLQEMVGGRAATYGEAQETLKTVQGVRYLGRLACMEASYAAALGLAVQRRHVDWHMGVSFYPVAYHSWIEANGSPVRTPIEGTVSGDFQSFFST